MPKVLACTQKMENYCVGIIAGKHQNVAYAEAYNAQNMKMAVISSKAVELNRHPLIVARIAELRAAAAKPALVTLEGHLNDLLALRNASARAGAFGAAIGAEIARGKAAGVHVEKSEQSIKVQNELPASVDDFV
jgi:hypothetical protein